MMKTFLGKIKDTNRMMKTFIGRIRDTCQSIFSPSKTSIVVLASAHKVGSTWLFNILKDIGNFRSPIIPAPLNDSSTLLLEKPGSSKFLANAQGRLIFKSHSFPIPVEKRGGAKFISVFRDPRDVVVSASFYLATLDQSLGGWEEKYRILNDNEKIKHFISNGGWCVDRLKAWFNDKNTCQVKYEQLLENTFDEVMKVAAFLNLEVEEEKLISAIAANSFSKKSGRKQGEEDKTSFYRKGISGDWRNYFDADLKHHFRTSLNGQWNALLIEMGYEQNSEW